MATRREQQPPAEASSASETPKPTDEFLRITAHIPDDVSETIGQEPTAKEETQQTLITPQLVRNALAPTFQTLFGTVAKFRGEHWRLEEYQTTALVDGWTPIVQVMLARLGSETEILLAAALIPTLAIVGGKLTQESTKLVSLTASTRTPKSEESSASSGSEEAARQPLQESLSEMEDVA